jgi:hypothetical protein
LTDDALIVETRRVVDVERRSTAELLELLNEIERRRLHLALGYSSLFTYCTRALALSEQAAYSRITAARAARRFPALIDRLSSGALTLSSIGVLAPHLTEENVDALLDAADGRSTRDAERLIAALHAQPDIASSVRALPARISAHRESSELTLWNRDDHPPATASAAAPAVVQLTPRHTPTARPVIAPIGSTRYLLKITIGEEAHAALERLRALLRHSVPDGDPAAIVSRALIALLTHTEGTKSRSVRSPQPQTTRGSRGRHIPAAVRRAVWQRDHARCAFVGTDGRCTETGFLEFHHVVPFAADGPTSTDNLQLRCRAHNAYEAALDSALAETGANELRE